MTSPVIADIDEDHRVNAANHADMEDQQSFDEVDFSRYSNPEEMENTPQENDTFPPSQNRAHRSQNVDDPQHHPHTPYHSQADHGEGESPDATSAILPPREDRVTPPGSRMPRPPSVRPPSGIPLKRMHADMDGQGPFAPGFNVDPYSAAPHPTDHFPDAPLSSEEEEFFDIANNFDPTAEVVPFDVVSLPNQQWNRLQDEMVQEIHEFINTFVKNSMVIAFDMAMALEKINNETRGKLLKAVEKIRREQESHRRSVDQFRRFAQFLDSGLGALGDVERA